MNTYVFFYLMNDQPDRIRQLALAHAKYWEELSLPGYEGGPLTDRSGGLIIFCANDDDVAMQLASGDPFMTSGMLAQYWVKAWIAR